MLTKDFYCFILRQCLTSNSLKDKFIAPDINIPEVNENLFLSLLFIARTFIKRINEKYERTR